MKTNIYKNKTSSFTFVRKKKIFIFNKRNYCIYDLNVLRAIQNISINLKSKTKIYKKNFFIYFFKDKETIYIQQTEFVFMIKLF